MFGELCFKTKVSIKPRGLLKQRVTALFNLLKVVLGRITFKYDYIFIIPLTLKIRVSYCKMNHFIDKVNVIERVKCVFNENYLNKN